MEGVGFGTFVVGYLACTAVVVFVLLFGESLVFQGTPVAWMHWAMTQGFWEASEWIVLRVCGERVSQRLQRCLECCCDKPNPILQISYVAIVTFMFALYWAHLFALLPNPGAAAFNKYAGVGTVLMSLAVFVAASRSDPGTITAHNVAAHASLYPGQGMELLWGDKECWTCHFMRPARSKHCSVCSRCVSRFDHHCGWINNCVGLGNLRLFLLFLISNVAMCTYGGILGSCILHGELSRLGLLRRKTMNWRTGEAEYHTISSARALEFLVTYYPVHVSIVMFMYLAALLLSAFFFYHMYLCSHGKTQYEAYRWSDLHKALILEEEDKQRQQRQQQHGQQQRPQGLARVATAFSRHRRPKVELPVNRYNKGFWHNLSEILYWESHLQAAAETAQSPKPTGTAQPHADQPVVSMAAPSPVKTQAGSSSSARRRPKA